MASDFSRHIGLSHKFFSAGDAAGLTPTHWNHLAEKPDLLKGLLEVLEGRSHIVPMPLLQCEGMHLPVLPEAYLIDWDAFQQRPDVYCLNGFKELIQKDQVAKPVERSISVGKAPLQRVANDTAIRQELPADHPLQLREFVWTILHGGAKRDGSWHISYVLIDGRVRVVGAGWSSVSEQWDFVSWGLDDCGWDAGDRVLFSDSPPQTA